MEGLWAGTAFFAAANSKTFAGFLGKYMVYVLILIVIFMIIAMLLQTFTPKEKFSVADIKCPKGSTPTEQCPGTTTPGCLHPSGNCEASLG